MRNQTLLTILFVSQSVFSGCLQSDPDLPTVPIENKESLVLRERFDPTENYQRTNVDSTSFAYYLRHLQLKPVGTPVHYYNGKIKQGQKNHLAVIDLNCGERDLQQCADAVMRLKAEYHFHRKEYEKIHFNFVSDGTPRYYTNYAKGDHSYAKFRKYLDYIYAYANTRSLAAELEPVADIMEMQIGDVLIQTGNPFGHAVIVVDMIEHKSLGYKQFMLAQSYMPAQDIHILSNPARPDSPWYTLRSGEIITPDWVFSSDDLKRFPAG